MRTYGQRIAMFLFAAAVAGVAALTLAQDKPSEQPASPDPLRLVEGDVVVFAGGANMVRMQRAGYLEAMLTHEFAPAKVKFRDWAWEADTVFRQGSLVERWRRQGHGGLAGLGDLAGQFKRISATVVVAQYGQLESLQGRQGLEEFTKAYERLVDQLAKQVRLVVLVSPTPFEKPSSEWIPDLSERNKDLALYVEATKKIATDRKLPFVDLFTGAKGNFTDNGMHIKSEAQMRVAGEIAAQLVRRDSLREPQPLFAERTTTNLEPLRRAVVEKHRLWYDYWRPANWKLLYGDDARRQFTRGDIPFREEWNKLPPMIAKAEERVWAIAGGGKDPGPNRPETEILHGDPGADIENELKSFTTAEGLEVNLFASEKEGLTSPLNLRWDPSGRMYVTVTTTYPHVFPGDVPNDKVIMLEDADGDGRADRSTVFAEGLNIPTGIEWGEGGVYVGQNTEILFLKDTDGDGKADQRRVLLGGFGNGDSHQTINSFVWSPGGELYFGQGDGCESRVETPWGASNLFQAGFFRFRPRRLQLHPLLDDFMGPGNPWGVAFDRWGQIFSIDGAGGVTFLSPGQVPVSHRLRLRTIGQPGGYCGIGYLHSRRLPESIRGDFAIGDFKANRVKRFSVREDGAGYTLHWEEPLLQSRHRNFRPVDVKLGPDGAIYVVDWYNPITCHQDDAYRHPARDKAHGRIWRISAKAKPDEPKHGAYPNLLRASTAEVIDALASDEHWTRYQARRALTVRDAEEVGEAIKTWAAALDRDDAQYEQHLFQALGALATIEVVDPGLLGRLLTAKTPQARAYAARLVGRWHDRLDDPLALLAERVVDDHPLVRMEGIMACAAIPSPESMAVAARAADLPMDSWIDYAFTQTAHHLRPHWSPAFERGELSFQRPAHLAAVLNKTGGRDVMDTLKRLVDSEDVIPAGRASAIAAILDVGGPQELYEYGLNAERFRQSGEYDAAAHAGALRHLAAIARDRNQRPAGNLAKSLKLLVDQSDPRLREAALTLAGLWKVDDLEEDIVASAKDESLPVNVRAAAFGAAPELGLSNSRKLLVGYAGKPHSPALRSAAIEALLSIDAPAAAEQATRLFSNADLQSFDAGQTITAFLNRSASAKELATALNDANIESARAEELLRQLYATGRRDESLIAALNKAIGVSGKPPDYSAAFVARLVAEAAELGDADRGAEQFKTRACITCHRVGDVGGIVGPDLTAIGTTLSPQRITEELLWPNRQVKEGYSVVEVITVDGKVLQGYLRRTRRSEESGDLVMRDLKSDALVTIKKDRIDEQHETGSPMPTGLTTLMTRPQMLDLIRYLSELGTQP